MPDLPPIRRFRFGAFEADEATGELRRKGIRIKLNAQPFQVLLLLCERAGEVLSRDEIARVLWPDGTFVDFEHGVNSAVNRIREALGDAASNPRFIETLARRGYRFVAPAERLTATAQPNLPEQANPVDPIVEPQLFDRLLATPQDLPTVRHPVVQGLYVALQLMYVGFYVGALANLAEIQDLLSPLAHAGLVFDAMVVTAALLIPARAFLVSAALLHPPGGRAKLLQLWLALLAFDILWALSPFLLLHHINVGLALGCTALLVYSPFAQRSLVLMGAGSAPQADGT